MQDRFRQEGVDTKLGSVDRFTIVAGMVENAALDDVRDREDLFAQDLDLTPHPQYAPTPHLGLLAVEE